VDQLVHRTQAIGRGDDEHASVIVVRTRKGARVEEFAAEVETAQERKDLAERRAPPDANALSEIERGPFAQDELGTLSAAVGRGGQEGRVRAPQVGATTRGNSDAVRVFSTSSRAIQARRAMATPYRTLPSSATECASVDTTKRIPRSRAARSQRGARSRRF